MKIIMYYAAFAVIVAVMVRYANKNK